MDPAVQALSKHSVAVSTRKTYDAALRRYSQFCFAFNVSAPFPVSEHLLCYFVSMLAFQGLALQTVKTYVSAVKHENVAVGFPDVPHTPRLRQLLLGVGRLQGSLRRSVPRTRLPITVHLIRGFMGLWSGGGIRLAALRAAVSVCFFGFFRSGELTVPSATEFDPRVHLSWGDVAVDDADPPTCVRVHLKRSKCDQMGKGVDVYIGATGDDDVCPVKAVLAYVAVRGTAQGPFFLLDQNSTPLTKPVFVAAVREGLRRLGMDDRLYAGHSFRIGAATTAAQRGCEDSLIQALGRWSSAAFLSYVRTPPAQVIAVARKLASC